MREFQAGSGQASKYVHALLGGKVSSGKTSFAATMPRPLFLSSVAEGGYKVLDSIDPRLFWDGPKGFKPVVWATENMLDYVKAGERLLNLAAQNKFPWGTVVFDSVSIYGESVLRELRKANPGGDARQWYGELAAGISRIVAELHSLPCHVLWLCHIDDRDQLAVPGKATAATWAYMDRKWLVRANVEQDHVNYQLHSRPFRQVTWLGGRGIQLPDPMIPSFKCVAEVLGLPEKPGSPSVPPFNGVEYWDGVSYLGA
jgi:hypothetical protein